MSSKVSASLFHMIGLRQSPRHLLHLMPVPVCSNLAPEGGGGTPTLLKAVKWCGGVCMLRSCSPFLAASASLQVLVFCTKLPEVTFLQKWKDLILTIFQKASFSPSTALNFFRDLFFPKACIFSPDPCKNMFAYRCGERNTDALNNTCLHAWHFLPKHAPKNL